MKKLGVFLFTTVVSISLFAQSEMTVQLKPKKSSKNNQEFFPEKSKSEKSQLQRGNLASAANQADDDPDPEAVKKAEKAFADVMNSDESKKPAAKALKITVPKGNLDIVKLSEMVHQKTGKKLLLGPSVKGSVYFMSRQTLTVEEFYRFFLEALTVNGLSIVEKDGYTVVDSARAITFMAPTLVEDPSTIKEERIISWFYPLKKNRFSDLKTLFSSRDGRVDWIESSNTILVTDFTSQVQRLQKVLEKLEK